MYSEMNKILNQMVALSKNTISHDAYDRMIFDRMFEKCKEMQYIQKIATGEPIIKEAGQNKFQIFKGTGEYHYPFMKELQQDIFYSFYKYNPKFLEDSEIQPEFLPHKTMIQKAQMNENWRKMRGMTKLDEVNSAIATTYFSEELLKEMVKRDKKFKLKMEFIEEQRKKLIEAMNKFANSKKKKEKEKLIKEMEETMKEIKNQVQKAIKSISQTTLSQAIKNATKKMAELNETTNVLAWGNKPAELQRASPEERIALASYLMENEKLFKLVRELGRLKNVFVETKRREIKHGTSEMYSVDIGKDIGKILPSEIMKMKHPILKRDFYKRFVEGELLEYSLRSKEKKEKGDIVVGLDLSGSMNLTLYDNITREIYAKALALAILEIAVRENRNYHLLLFGTSVKKTYNFSKKNKPKIQDIIEIASTFLGGGTNFEAPLNEALQMVNENADIVFITDGECRVGKDFLIKFNAVKKKLNFQVVALQVGDATTEFLEEFSDHVINFTNFIETSKNVFSKLEKGGGA